MKEETFLIAEARRLARLQIKRRQLRKALAQVEEEIKFRKRTLRALAAARSANRDPVTPPLLRRDRAA